MAVSKDSIRKLIKRAEEMQINVGDFFDKTNYKDGFIKGVLWQYGINTNEEALQYCIEHNLRDLNDLLEYIGKDLWK